MAFSLNDKRLLKIYFVLALDNPEPKRTPFFVFMKKRYFQTRKVLLLSQKKDQKIYLKCFLLCVYFLR